MTEIPATDSDSERYRQACDWFLRLREEPDNVTLVADWLSWCRADPANYELFESVRRNWIALRSSATLTLSEGSEPKRQAPYLWKIAAAATLGAVAVAVAWIATRGPTPLSGHDDLMFITALSEHRNVLLPDGSRVEMAGNSRLRVRLREHRRDLELEKGEAYFSVAHDGTRPFIVNAGDLHVRAVGTRFDVRRTTDRVVVAVEEGVVVVEPLEPSASAAVEAMIARLRGWSGHESIAPALRAMPVRSGQELALGSPDRAFQVQAIEPQAVASWRQGRLRFAREPLKSVIDSIRSVSGQDIELADPGLANLRFTGTVFSSAVNSWVSGLPAIFPVEVHRDGARIIITRRTGSEK